MELIYTDVNGVDIGTFSKRTQIDFEIGLSDCKNDFTITMPTEDYDERIRKGSIVYSDTEIGGIVIGLESNTKTNKVTLHGSNWRNIIAQQVIVPPSGSDYYVFNGDVANLLIALLDPYFGGRIVADSHIIGVNVKASFRYTNKLFGIEQALNSVGYRLAVDFDPNEVKAIVKAVPILTLNKEYSNDYGYNLIVKDIHNGANHMIALGRGELSERTVYECWRLSDGTITESKSTAVADGVTGVNIRTYVYDYPSAENLDVLKESALEKFGQNADTVSFDISNVNDADIGNYISIRERIIGLSMTKKVKSRLYKGYLDFVKVSNNIGD